MLCFCVFEHYCQLGDFWARSLLESWEHTVINYRAVSQNIGFFLGAGGLENTATFKKLADELEEIKKSLSFFFVWGNQQSWRSPGAEGQNQAEGSEDWAVGTEALEDLELYSRINDPIITGLDTKHRRDQQGQHTPPEELHTWEEQVVSSTVRTLIYRESTFQPVTPFHIRTPKPCQQLLSSSQKAYMVNVIRPSKQLKCTGVYVNEHLTKKDVEIARNGRILREQNKNQTTRSRKWRL